MVQLDQLVQMNQHPWLSKALHPSKNLPPSSTDMASQQPLCHLSRHQHTEGLTSNTHRPRSTAGWCRP